MSTQQPCHLPQICSQPLAIAGQTWTIYYSQQDDIIFHHPLLRDQLVHSLETQAGSSFRQQIHLQTIPFLMAVNDSTQEVSLLSPRGHRELFLLTHLNYDHLTPSDQVLYQKLAQHVARAKALESTNFPGPIDHLAAHGELASLADPPWATLQAEVATLSQQLSQRVKNYRPELFEFLSDYGLHLIANYDLLRIHLLKFVAVLSALDFDRSGQEVKRLLQESLHRLGKDHRRAKQQKLSGTRRPLPPLLAGLWRGGLFLVHLLPAKFWGLTIRPMVRKMAQRFITGETIEQAQPKLLALLASGRDATLDQLGELVVSAQEADTYCQEILRLIRSQQSFVSPGTQNRAHINRAHISLKLSALCHDFNPYAFDSTYRQIANRLITILETAAKHQVFINIDAEHYRYRDTAFAIYRKLLLTNKQLKNYQQTGIVVQSYLRDAADHLQEVIELAQKRGLTMPIRLVKGAYWDAETIEAQAHGYDAPEFLNKEETDIHYHQLMIAVLKNFPHVQLCVGSHNLEDHCYSEVLRERHFPHTPPIEHQCLHMTYEALSQAMAQHGLVVRNYVPVGPLLVGMSYLVRRIMENSSQVGILAQMRSRKVLAPRPSPWERWQDKKHRGAVVQDPGSSLSGEFFNIPPVRLYRKIERDAFIRAGEQLAPKLPRQPGVAPPPATANAPWPLSLLPAHSRPTKPSPARPKPLSNPLGPNCLPPTGPATCWQRDKSYYSSAWNWPN